jgi:hypothetical protein
MKIVKGRKIAVITDREQCSHHSAHVCFHPNTTVKECSWAYGGIGFPENCPLPDAKEEKNERNN